MTTTIVMLVSRDNFLTKVISSLELLECDQSRTNLFCLVDGDNNLYLRVRRLVQGTKFNERLTLQYPHKKLNKKYDITYRRKRIAELHNYAAEQLSDCDYVFVVEDDTIQPRSALQKLLKIASETPSFGMAEGVELGRWGYPYVGAWWFDDIYNPQQLKSIQAKDNALETIDAGGLYCALIKAHLYRKHIFNTFEGLGADIHLGISLRRMGYENFIDWTIKCTHLCLENNVEKMIKATDESKIVTLLKHGDIWKIKY